MTLALRRAKVRVELRRGFWGGLKEARLWTSPGHYYSVKGAQWLAIEGGAAPLVVGEEDGRTLWATSGGLFWDDDGHGGDDVALLLWDRRRRQDHRLERLRQQREASAAAEQARRKRIPSDVQVFVWERDDGRCVRCDVTADLQFDHVIPVAKGGGNTAENVQLLCGTCNRMKSDSVG
jgi:hypothetical protein